MTNTIKDFIDAADDNRTQRVMKEMYEALDNITAEVESVYQGREGYELQHTLAARLAKQALTNVEQIIKETGE